MKVQLALSIKYCPNMSASSLCAPPSTTRIMATRVSLRRVGSTVGKKAALPATLDALLELATSKLGLTSPARRIFAEDGDEYDAEDVQLISKDDVLYVSCGEDFGPPTAEPAPNAPPIAELPTVPPIAEPPPAAAPVETCEPIAEPPPAAAPVETCEPAAEQPPPLNPFDVLSLDDKVVEAAVARGVKPISVDATRDKIKVEPSSLFSFMARGGSGAGGAGAKLFILKVPDGRSDSNGDIFDFCSEPGTFLKLRSAAAPEGDGTVEGAAGSSSAAPLPPPLIMGDWEVVKVPPAEAKKDKGVSKIALKPSVSALKVVFELRQQRSGAKPGWQYPSNSALIEMFNTDKYGIKYQDFRSVIALTKPVLKAEKKEAKAAARQEDTFDFGGVRKLEQAHKKVEEERKKRARVKQEAWQAREQALDNRLETANDVLAHALTPDKPMAQEAVEVLEEERRTFMEARALEKKELAEERATAKRKFDSDMEKQRTYNATVKGEGRKKVKAAIAAAAAKEPEPVAVPMEESAVTMSAGAAAAARDPILILAKATVAAAVAAALQMEMAAATVAAALTAAVEMEMADA